MNSIEIIFDMIAKRKENEEIQHIQQTTLRTKQRQALEIVFVKIEHIKTQKTHRNTNQTYM